MRNASFAEIAAALRSHQRIAVLSHVRPDGDAPFLRVAMGRRSGWSQGGITDLLSWLRVSGTTKMPRIDHGVRHQLHTVLALLLELEAQQQPFEFVLPCEGPFHAEP